MVGLKNQRLLVIAPHPDDEILGCGGLIKRVKEAGGKVYVLFMTVGNTKDFAKNGRSTSQGRIREIEKVAKFLKYDDYYLAFPGDAFHLKLDHLPQFELISVIESGPLSLARIKPTIIASPQVSDYNQDHRSVAQAVMAATRPAPNEFKPLQKLILGYEFSATSLWNTPPNNNPNLFVELNKSSLEAKIQALKLYSSQLRNGYHPRSINVLKSLAYLRGSQSGVEAAEAFYNYRMVI